MTRSAWLLVIPNINAESGHRWNLPVHGARVAEAFARLVVSPVTTIVRAMYPAVRKGDVGDRCDDDKDTDGYHLDAPSDYARAPTPKPK